MCRQGAGACDAFPQKSGARPESAHEPPRLAQRFRIQGGKQSLMDRTRSDIRPPGYGRTGRCPQNMLAQRHRRTRPKFGVMFPGTVETRRSRNRRRGQNWLPESAAIYHAGIQSSNRPAR